MSFTGLQAGVSQACVSLLMTVVPESLRKLCAKAYQSRSPLASRRSSIPSVFHGIRPIRFELLENPAPVDEGDADRTVVATGYLHELSQRSNRRPMIQQAGERISQRHASEVAGPLLRRRHGRRLRRPDVLEIGALPAGEEERLAALYRPAEEAAVLPALEEVLFGREASLAVRKDARRAYLLIAARLAAVPVAEGKTLRQLLASPGQSSRWWYHRVSFKDCEADPTFDRVIALFTIIKVAEERGIGDLVLVGGPPEFRAVLEQSLRVRALSESSNGFVYLCVRSLASRLAFGLKTAYECWLARRHPAPEKFDVAFSGFWGRSI